MKKTVKDSHKMKECKKHFQKQNVSRKFKR